MVADHESDENAPNHPRPSAEREEPYAQRDLKRNIEVLQPAIEWLGVEVGREVQHFLVRRQRDVVLVEPCHVCPRETAMNAMGIAFLVSIGVMLAVHRYPSDWIALQRQRSEDRKQVF